MSLESEINALLSPAIENKRLPGFGAIALDKSGKVLYKGTFGSSVSIEDASKQPFTSTTQTNIWSLTKLVTSIAILQLSESGQINIDDAAEKYVPEISKLQVLEGWTSPDAETGDPITRPAKTKITIRHLLTHTSGLAYDFVDANIMRWYNWRQRTQGIPRTGRKVSDFSPPLLFEPGTSYVYGVGCDWLGFVVEAVTGIDLDTYFQRNIFAPLGLQKTGLITNVPVETVLHARLPEGDGKAVVSPLQIDLAASYGEKDEKEHQTFGGQYLISTLDDYATILLTILNDGTHPSKKDTQILKPETVQNYLFTDQLPAILGPQGSDVVGTFNTAFPALSADGVFLPGTKKGFSTGLLLNLEDVPGKRRANSGAWAGVSNQYYWLDRESGKLGLVITYLLPFLDAESLDLFDGFEKL
ncbi:MAG: hypothetical protein DI539_14160, partial [Flavobacterium psychrophilum]